MRLIQTGDCAYRERAPVLCAIVAVAPMRAHEGEQMVGPQLCFAGHRMPTDALLVIHGIEGYARLQVQ